MFETRVIFFQVKDTASKLLKVCQTAQAHFEKKERLLIFAPNAAACEFIDALLWRMPEDSFLPHTLNGMPAEGPILIASSLGQEELPVIPNVSENLDFRPSQSLGVGRSQLARISNTGDVAIAPTARAFASVQNQIFKHVRYRVFNVSPQALLPVEPFKVIYELDDRSSPEKQQLSEARFTAYRKTGCHISTF